MSLSFIFRETLKGIKNNIKMALTSVFIMSFSLFFFMFFIILTLNSLNIIYKRANEIKFEVYPSENLNNKFMNFFKDLLSSLRGVKRVIFVDSKEGRELFLKDYPEYKELLNIFEEEIFPPKFTLELKPYVLLRGEIPELKSFISRLPGIKEVYFGEEYLLKVFKLLVFLLFIDIFFFFFLLFLLSLTILQTLRLTIRSRLKLLEVLYLVGADEEYIRSPFALEGSIYGFFGSIIASILFFAFITLLKKLFGVTFLFVVPTSVAIIAFGVLLGFLSSQIALADLKAI